MTREEMFWTLRAMESFGGSFVQALAHLYETADQINKEIVLMAFSAYFDTYKQKGTQLQESHVSQLQIEAKPNPSDLATANTADRV